MSLSVRDRRLIAPRELPDGRVVWERREDIVRRLREGDPTMGWEGDPALDLVLNLVDHCWEVWRKPDDRPATKICTAPQRGMAMPNGSLIRALMAHDTRHVDVVDEVDAHNARLERERALEATETNGAVADKLAWALGRDLDIPAPSGRLYPTGKR